MDYSTQTATTEFDFEDSDPQDWSVAIGEFFQTAKDLTQDQFQGILKELSLIRSDRSM